MVGTLLVPHTGNAEACAATGHGRLYLAALDGGINAGSKFYSAPEGESATATIRPTPGDCHGEGASGEYATSDGTAMAGEDYSEEIGSTQFLCADIHPQYCGGAPSEQTVDVFVLHDGEDEAAVESFVFALTSGTRGLAEPSSVPVHIIDIHGLNRASLEPSLSGGAVAYEHTEFGSIRIPVFWAGTSAGGSVGFSVDPDPAAPATPGEDYVVTTPSPLSIGSDRLGFIDIDIVNDKLGEGPESVVITLAGTVDGPASTTFTILDNEENVFPSSRFHHPRHKWKYKKSDYRIREFHIFATDNAGGSGVVAAELALRRNLKNGKCAWKGKKGWQKKDCQNRTWLPTKYDDVGELYYYRMNQLKPSVKTKIKNYTAFSRAIDGAGNVEKEFVQKRNDNTFEIKKKKRRG